MDLCRVRIEKQLYGQPATGSIHIEMLVDGELVLPILHHDEGPVLDGAWAYTWVPCGSTVQSRHVQVSRWSNEITAIVPEPTQSALIIAGIVLLAWLWGTR